jgi:type I restriction enzyme S subunit
MRSEAPLSTTLGAICEQQGGTIQTGPFGSQLHASDYAASGTPVVMPADIVGGRVSTAAIARVGFEHVERLSQHQLRFNDIVFSRRGDVTRFARVTEREVGWLCGTGCLKVRVGTGTIALPEWISIALGAPEVKDWLVRHAVGATMPNLNTSILGAVPLRVPPIEQQREAVEVCFALDDRIDLLRQTNATLESIAQALFKSWFIDFDPVRAKAEGREPEGMDAATAALFPAEFEESVLGLIPKGWQVRSLDSFASYLNGLAMQKFPPKSEEESLPVIKIAQLRAGNTIGSDRASSRLRSEYIVKDGDVLFSWSGSLEVEIWCGGVGALNQHLFKVTSAEVPKWFYYLATRHFLPAFREIAAHKATTMGHIQRRHLTDARLALPPPVLMIKLGEILGPLLQRRIANSLQARELSALRDTLLPRLISGRLRLPEAQAELEEALT